MPEDFPMPDKPRQFSPIRSSRPVSPSAIADKYRGKTTERGYGADWRRLRRWVLSRSPLCQHCKDSPAGTITLAVDLHHIQSVKSCPERRLDPSNLISLCRSCHVKEEARLISGKK